MLIIIQYQNKTQKTKLFFKIYFEKKFKKLYKNKPLIPKTNQTQHTNPTRTLITISRKRLPSIFRKRSDKLKRDLEDAVREPNSSFTHHRNSSGSSIHGGGDPYDDSDRDTLSGDHNVETGCDAEMYGSPNDQFHVGGMGYMKSANPTNIYMKFEAHETESHAVRWSPIERVIATGGADRKVKLWDVGKGKLRY